MTRVDWKNALCRLSIVGCSEGKTDDGKKWERNLFCPSLLSGVSPDAAATYAFGCYSSL